MQIYCFRIGKEYKYQMPWPVQPTVVFSKKNGHSKVILAGEPGFIINNRLVKIKVWEVTILPFTQHADGMVTIADKYAIPFSTFKVTK